MNEEPAVQRSETDAELQRQTLSDRKLSLSEAIGSLAGPGSMKGASPIPRKHQAEMEIDSWLRHHLPDVSGAFRTVLFRRVKTHELLLNNFEQPLIVLAGCIQQTL